MDFIQLLRKLAVNFDDDHDYRDCICLTADLNTRMNYLSEKLCQLLWV